MTTKNMTNSEARKKGKRDLRAVFSACRFLDGLTYEEEKLTVGSNDFIYYYNKSRDGQIGNYIVYEVVSTEPNTRADNAVFLREFFAQVDVFCTSSFESKLMQDTLAKLEERLTAQGFEIEMREENYESDTRLYHQALFVSKIF